MTTGLSKSAYHVWFTLLRVLVSQTRVNNDGVPIWCHCIDLMHFNSITHSGHKWKITHHIRWFGCQVTYRRQCYHIVKMFDVLCSSNLFWLSSLGWHREMDEQNWNALHSDYCGCHKSELGLSQILKQRSVVRRWGNSVKHFYKIKS